MHQRKISAQRDRVINKAIEPLEARRLLAGTVGAGGTGAGGGGTGTSPAAPFDITTIPVFHPVSSSLTDYKSGPLAPAGDKLGKLYLDFRHAVLAKVPYKNTDTMLASTADNKVGVTLRIRTNDLPRFVSGLVNAYQFQTTAMNESLSVVQGYLPIEWIRVIAQRTDVAQMSPIYRASAQKLGKGDDQGDKAMNADTARTNFKVDGTGVKVGVLSDSVGKVGGGLADSVKTGDLPNNVQVIADGTDKNETDEGRAMLEEVHDVAPGAALAFATADGGQQAFANNITALKNAGANVIVDDIGYPNEPMFQDGVIDTAIRGVTAAGATYLTSAGNSGGSGYTGAVKFITNTDEASQETRTLVNFNTATAGGKPSAWLVVTVDAGGALVLGWDEPYNGVTGSAKTDLDLYVYKHDNTFDHIKPSRFFGNGNLVTESVDNNIATGIPEEFVGLSAGVYDVEIELGQPLGLGVTPPTLFRLNGELGLKVHNWGGATATVLGHEASGAAISVGAVPWYGAPPVSKASEILSEDFSSVGGQKYLFDAAGNRLATPTIALEPAVAGIDGIDTSFFGETLDSSGRKYFFGTSAAAPNVAAVVALIKQTTPNATQSQILSALQATARPVNGTPFGNWDAQGGFGLVDANLAVQQFTKKPTGSITSVDPTKRGTPVPSVTVTFDEYVSGLTSTDFSLRLNGGGNLISGAQTLATLDHKTFTLGNLAGITGAVGTYILSLDSAASGVTTSPTVQTLSNSPSTTWQMITPPVVPIRPTNFVLTALSSNSIQLNWDDVNTTETEYTVQRADNVGFTSHVKTYHLAADAESFVSNGLGAGTRYYYRVRGVNTTGPGKYASTLFSLTRVGGEIVVDDSSQGVQVSGFWGSSTAGGDFVGQDFLQDGNSAKGTKIVKYNLPILASGQYYVYGHWTSGSNRATNTPFDIFYGPGSVQHTTVLVDQRNRGGGGWTLIGGPYMFDKGTGPAIRIRNAGTNGIVVADGIRLLPSGPLKLSSYTGKAPAFATGPSAFAQPKHDNDLLNVDDSLL